MVDQGTKFRLENIRSLSQSRFVFRACTIAGDNAGVRARYTRREYSLVDLRYFIATIQQDLQPEKGK